MVILLTLVTQEEAANIGYGIMVRVQLQHRKKATSTIKTNRIFTLSLSFILFLSDTHKFSRFALSVCRGPALPRVFFLAAIFGGVSETYIEVLRQCRRVGLKYSFKLSIAESDRWIFFHLLLCLLSPTDQIKLIIHSKARTLYIFICDLYICEEIWTTV